MTAPSIRTAQPVDIAIVTWNTRELTLDCLRRIYQTDHGAPVRVLIHDNASTDGTAEAIRSTFPQADVEVAADNLGFAVGVNQLIARSSAPWFLMLNSDAWLEPGALLALLGAAAQHPRAAAVVPRIENPDGQVEHTVQPFPTPAAAIRLALPGYRRFRTERAAELLMPGVWHHDRSREVDWAVGAAWLVPRRALEELGGLDERLFMYGEDLDWCWRAHERGWTVWFEASALVRHVRNASGQMRFGSRRDLVALHNSYEVARWHQGRWRTSIARGAHLAWARLALFRARRGTPEADFWRSYVRSQRAAAKLQTTGRPD